MAELLSSHERQYVRDSVAEGVRSDGRGLLQWRDVAVRTGVIPYANSSAMVTLGSVEGTQVLVCLRAQLGPPLPSENSARLIVSVTRKDSSGKEESDADAELQSIAHNVKQVISAAMADTLNELVIVPNQRCWHLCIDAEIIHSSGNVMDAVVLGTAVVLNKARIPRVEVVTLEDGQVDMEVSSTLDDAITLHRISLPVCVTMCWINGKVIVDATQVEESSGDARMAVFVNAPTSTKDGSAAPALIQGTVQLGEGRIDAPSLFRLIEAAYQCSAVLYSSVAAALDG